MRKLVAIGLLITIALIMSCQPSAQIKSDMEKQAEQIRMLDNKIETLNTKLEQMMNDFKKHMDEFHKKTSKQKKLPAMGYVPIMKSLTS